MAKKLLYIAFVAITCFSLLHSRVAFSNSSIFSYYNFTDSRNIVAAASNFISFSDTSKIALRGKENFAPEKHLNYPNNNISQNFSFDLKPLAKRKFSVSFLNKNHNQVNVKIYDVIGNLLIEESVIGKGYFYKEYDLSFYKSDLFIVEVGNAKYNKTKSLMTGGYSL